MEQNHEQQQNSQAQQVEVEDNQGEEEQNQEPNAEENTDVKEEEKPAQKTPEELEEERRLQEEEAKRVEQQARQKAEEERVKLEQDTNKLGQALKGSLSKIGSSTDNRSMQYTTLVLAEKELERLFNIILVYKQVKYLDISTNAISDISVLREFKDLVTLNASKNQISSLEIFNNEDSFSKLQVLNLSGNKITELSDVVLPVLVRLSLDENEISSVTWKGHRKIKHLQLKKNKLKKCQSIADMPHLLELHLEENEISDIRGLANLPALNKLYLNTNKIKRILSPFPFLPSLNHIDLSQNSLSKAEEIQRIDKHIASLNLKENPISDELGDNLKKDFACIYPHLETINEEIITPEERKQFQKQWKQKLEEQERERAEREKEAEEARRVQEEQQEEERRRLKEEQEAENPPVEEEGGVEKKEGEEGNGEGEGDNQEQVQGETPENQETQQNQQEEKQT